MCVYIYIDTLFKIVFNYRLLQDIYVFHYRLLQDIAYSYLCYIGGPYWLSILYIIVPIFSFQPPNLFLPCTLFL